MRILFCNYEYPPLGGGGGVINALLAEQLAQKHEVTVLTSQGFQLQAEETIGGVRILRVPVFFRRQKATASMLSMFSYLPMGWLHGRRLLRSAPFDIINTHFVLPTGPVGDALSRFSKLPNVLSVHGGDLYDPSKSMSPHRHWLLRVWVRALLRRADCVVGQSRNTVDNVKTIYTPEINPELIPLGIKRPPQALASRADYGFNEKDCLLITVGRLVARKAIDQLIAMLARINDTHVKLLIVGTGLQEQALRQKASELGVTERVFFMGHVSEAQKFALLRLSDAFVSTSQHEGFGLVFLEAMACGLPVVCYDFGGQSDFLMDGATGYLVPLNNLDGFTEACRRTVQDPAKNRSMGLLNQKRVEEFYIENCAVRYLDLFEQVIARHRATAGAA